MAIFAVISLGAVLGHAQDKHFCRVTKPNGSTPPHERPSAAHHGNGALWTALPLDGKVVIYRDHIQSDGWLEMKFPWWRAVEGKLAIYGRRLDAPAPGVRAKLPDGYGDTGVQASGIIFPTEGCWEIIGKAGTASLTFVIQVIKSNE